MESVSFRHGDPATHYRECGKLNDEECAEMKRRDAEKHAFSKPTTIAFSVFAVTILIGLIVGVAWWCYRKRLRDDNAHDRCAVEDVLPIHDYSSFEAKIQRKQSSSSYEDADVALHRTPSMIQLSEKGGDATSSHHFRRDSS